MRVDFYTLEVRECRTVFVRREARAHEPHKQNIMGSLKMLAFLGRAYGFPENACIFRESEATDSMDYVLVKRAYFGTFQIK